MPEALFMVFYRIPRVQKCENLVDLVESFQTFMYYLLAKFGVDTAENEPLKVSPKLLEAKSLTII